MSLSDNMVKKVSSAEVEQVKEVGPTVQPEEVIAARGPRVLAIVDDGKRSRLMLHELKQRGITFTEAKADFKNLEKEVPKLAEGNKDNFDVVYLPVSNTEYNKNPSLYNQIKQESKDVPVNFYFDGHDDQELSNRCFRLKIE